MHASLRHAAFVFLAALACSSASAQYPRIANLWGVGPGASDYDSLARYGFLVMAGGSPDEFRRFRAEMRKRNPDIVLLGTAPLMNLGAPEATPWMKKE